MANADKSNSDSVYEINQQTGLTLKGVVKDVKNEPLIGVNVLIKGTTTGAITDLDGAFTMNVKKGDILVISYTGYETQEVVVKDNSPLNIVLKENLTELNEVVVTALGIKKETKALTYNVQEIKAAELVTVKDANFMNALSGKIAGVTINSTSSDAWYEIHFRQQQCAVCSRRYSLAKSFFYTAERLVHGHGAVW